MGIHDRDYYREETQGFNLGDGSSLTTKIIIANVIVFVVDMFVGDNHWLMQRIALTPETLANPLQWWKFLSYAFAHEPRNLWHILGNMLTLWFFGRDVELSLPNLKEYLRFYLVSAFLGGLAWTLRYWLLEGEVNAALMGASGAVTAVVILFVMMHPRRRIMIYLVEVPAWVLGAGVVAVNVLGAGASRGGVAYDVHLVGAAFAACYYHFHWNLAYVIPDWLFANWKKWKRPFKPSTKLKLHKSEPAEDDLETEADQILEKVHREGEASLTKNERQILENYSRRVRQKNIK